MNPLDADDRRTPTPEALAHHLRRHAPRPGGRTTPLGAVAAIGFVLAVVLFTPMGQSVWVPWLAMAGLAGWVVYRGRSAQTLQREVARVYEMALLRRWGEALRTGWKLLPRLTATPQHHAQVVSLAASCLLRLRGYEAAIVACDHLLGYLPGETGAAHYLRLQRLGAMLGADRLTDAADELAKMRTATLGPMETAMFTLASLHQQVKTNHHADAAAEAEDAAARLRPLGTEAGYGYALLAAAFAQTDRRDEAGAWWRKATMLLAPAAIAWELPEIADTDVMAMTPAKTIADVAGGSRATDERTDEGEGAERT